MDIFKLINKFGTANTNKLKIENYIHFIVQIECNKRSTVLFLQLSHPSSHFAVVISNKLSGFVSGFFFIFVAFLKYITHLRFFFPSLFFTLLSFWKEKKAHTKFLNFFLNSFQYFFFHSSALKASNLSSYSYNML